MLNTLPSEGWRREGGLKAVLLDDPALLEHEIWRIFETELGPGAVQLVTAAMQGAKVEATWEVALAQLAKEGIISRQRLLDASLDGLSRDLHDQRARWFAILHDRPLRDLLEARREGIAVSLRGRLEEWMGVRNEPEEEPAEDDLADLERRAAALDPRSRHPRTREAGSTLGPWWSGIAAAAGWRLPTSPRT